MPRSKPSYAPDALLTTAEAARLLTQRNHRPPGGRGVELAQW